MPMSRHSATILLFENTSLTESFAVLYVAIAQGFARHLSFIWDYVTACCYVGSHSKYTSEHEHKLKQGV